MSIDATGSSSNYMSTEDIMAWMETKTEGMYGQMRDAMDTTDRRTDLESALNSLKAEVLAAKNGSVDPMQVATDAFHLQQKYGAEYPDLAKALQPMIDAIDKRTFDSAQKYKQAVAAGQNYSPAPPESGDVAWANGMGSASSGPPSVPTGPDKVTVSDDDATDWTKDIDGEVDALGKKDQLGLITIQDLNSQLNQAKQTASALIDSANKASDSIISHIS